MLDPVGRGDGTGVGSVCVLPVAVGGCGACAQSVRALRAPRYDLQLRRHGISFTETPRHADVALVTGALSRQDRGAAGRYLDAMPHPRVLVAVGNCAIDGCVFAGSPCLAGSAAEALDVHVEIGGCPPEPDAVLAAILQAKWLLEAHDADEPGNRAGADASAASEARDDEEGRDA